MFGLYCCYILSIQVSFFQENPVIFLSKCVLLYSYIDYKDIINEQVSSSGVKGKAYQ